MKVHTLRPLIYAANEKGNTQVSVPKDVIADIPEWVYKALRADKSAKRDPWFKDVKEEDNSVETYETKIVEPETKTAGFGPNYDRMSYAELKKIAKEKGLKLFRKSEAALRSELKAMV